MTYTEFICHKTPEIADNFTASFVSIFCNSHGLVSVDCMKGIRDFHVKTIEEILRKCKTKIVICVLFKLFQKDLKIKNK